MKEQNNQNLENQELEPIEEMQETKPTSKNPTPKMAIILGSIALAVAAIVAVLIILLGGNNSNQNSTDSTNSNNNTQTHENCTTTGIHTYEKGKCTGCGIKVFDIIKKYIIDNADPNNSGGGRYFYYCGSYTDDTNFTIFEYDSSKNLITILARYRSYPHTYSTDLYLTPYTLEDGEYEWEGDCIKLGCNCIGLSGYFDPAKFSSSTNKMPHSSSGNSADYMAEKYAKALQINMSEEIIPFLKKVGYNITISDLGFARY